jgi:NAD(P)-dependent dehydrogenase (short-subunit alcohol dehydrogenase family)
MIPVHRAGEPEDVARLAAFLASDDASFINGADILIDGGIAALAP